MDKQRNSIETWKKRGIGKAVGRNGGYRHLRWFERLLAELGFELWIGDPAEIKAKPSEEAEVRPRGCLTLYSD